MLELLRIVVMIVAFLIAIIPHEVAHGLAAERLGDPTARRLGRITLNPLRHIDPMMTIILPGMLILLGSPVIFGGAKPVPVDTRYFRNPRKDMAWVAFAGPLTNFAIALACIIAIPFATIIQGSLQFSPLLTVISQELLFITVLINLFLGAFNLIPIPPLDGGRIAVGFLPLPLAKVVARLEPFGIPIVFALLLMGAIDILIKPLELFLLWLSKFLL